MGCAALLIIMMFGVIIAFLTPARQLMPGYLKESERSQAEMQLIRLDSLRMAFEVNEAYIANLKQIMNPEAQKNSASHNNRPNYTPTLSIPYASETLIPTSAEETRFVAQMREREKYNVSVVAPLAAESMMFNSVNRDAILAEKSRMKKKAEIILPERATIAAIADGTVISVSRSIRDGGSVIIIQHPKGFLSRLSRVGSVLVEAGDMVNGGQIIALSDQGNGIKGELINLEMWFNGLPLIPYDYIGNHPSGYLDTDYHNEQELQPPLNKK